jgi:hypothetical protein
LKFTHFTVESEGNYAPGEPYYTPAMSQSSEGSSLDLLDDEKRKAFMMKLMASPDFAVAMRENENEQPGYQNYAQTVSNGPGYMTQLIAPGNGNSTENNVSEEGKVSSLQLYWFIFVFETFSSCKFEAKALNPLPFEFSKFSFILNCPRQFLWEFFSTTFQFWYITPEC